ncbi:hypothetical protein [Salipiger sp. PrR002]|uniref:hypothetical protein n=1 Tax=Salipiger sp. PrR002 TaxID=2706489 RepID=UPI0013BB8B30|nr:hypothetical protein [Salipiger sp. PrR002]NDW01318.1 hypothetical protein [Salipiger sp. PrR002]NDW58893.1 hypothetical protein [Salipiger sp. PrR004]
MQIAPKNLFEAPLERPTLAPGIRLGRGWHAEVGAAWSRSRLARLLVLAEQYPDPVPVLLRLRAFDAAPNRPRQLRAESPGHAPVSLTITTPEPVAVLLHTPHHAPGAEISEISLELDQLGSPFLSGRSPDERLLGLSVTEIQPGAPDIAFPLEFTTSGAAASALVEGWAPPEAGGSWSLGSSAVLHLPGYLSPGTATELVFEGNTLPRSAEQPPLEIDLREAGSVLASWRITSDTAGPWVCPLPDWTDARDRRFELVIRNTMSPHSLGINADTRELGLQLQRLSLRSGD